MAQFDPALISTPLLEAAFVELAMRLQRAEQQFTPAPGDKQPNKIQITLDTDLKQVKITAILPIEFGFRSLGGAIQIAAVEYLPGVVPDAGYQPIGGAPSTGSSDYYESEADIATLVGMPLYLKPNGHVDAASAADGITALVRGLAIAVVNPTQSAIYVDDGFIDRDDWTPITSTTNLVINSDYYLSADPGKLTTIPPETGWVSRVGFAASPTRLSLEIEPSIQL